MKQIFCIAMLGFSFLAFGQISQEDMEAREYYNAAIEALEAGEQREVVAEKLKVLANEYPDIEYAQDALELSDMLLKMAKEDADWVEPDSLDALSEDELLQYYTFRLRNVKRITVSSIQGREADTQPPDRVLLGMGDRAIPALIKMLDDMRPTRTVWRCRRDMVLTVLRYKDVAIRLLDQMTPAPFYRQAGSEVFFSTEGEEYQAALKKQYQSWYEKASGKTGADRCWAALESNIGIDPVMDILEKLAFDFGQTEQVLEALNMEIAKRHPILLPQISYLMCRLGNTSQIDAALEISSKKPENVKMLRFEDSLTAIVNASYYAYRQLILYGKEPHHDYLREKINELRPGQSDFLVRELCNLASNQFDFYLPEEYDRSLFPVDLLIISMDTKCVREDRDLLKRVIRSLQAITEQDFGLKSDASEEEVSEAVKKISQWWQEQGSEA